MKVYLKYAAGLIVLYLIVENSTGFGTAVKSGASGASSIITAFQGR